MRRSQIKTKLDRDEPALITCCHLNDPSVYELTSLLGFDGGNPDMPYGTMPMEHYTQFANEQTVIIIQIEEQHALDQAERIAQVERESMP